MLGKTARTPAPVVPGRRPCEAVGSVTGFQIDRRRRPGAVQGARGRLDRRLGDRPLEARTSSEYNFFADFYESGVFGTAPTARISVIKRRDERNYKLKAQSPVVALNSVLGHAADLHPHRPAEDPQGRVPGADDSRPGSPSFAVGLSAADQRLALEPRAGQCGTATDDTRAEQVDLNGKPQQKVGATREYGCDYKGARLLYWGYYVPPLSGR